MQRYVAFFRGINVGGNKKVDMKRLKKLFEEMGLEDVKTMLNSGNVVFSAAGKSTTELEKALGKEFEDSFRFSAGIIVRSGEDIKSLIQSDPFRGIKILPETRLYVTFVTERSKQKPYMSEGRFRFLRLEDGMLCTAINLSPEAGTLDLMKAIEQRFGKNVTTRNFETIKKIGDML